MKIVIEVPMLFKITVPDRMSEAELRKAVWEELRDSTLCAFSTDGFRFERITPKRATVWRALADALGELDFCKELRKAARALRMPQAGTGTDEIIEG